MADSLRRVPAWAWLAGIVVASCLFRWWYGRGMVAPFIMVDELIYSDLGRSLAAGDGLEVRGEPYLVSLVYPLLLAPVYALFDSLTEAYAAVKVVNSVVMSTAAIPAYFLARRVLPTGLSLFAALLAVAVPSMVYTGTVMTENAFYPAFLLVAWALVRMLERPTWGSQLLALSLALGAALIRVQALALVLAVLTAPLLLRRSLRSYAPLYGVALGGAALLVLAQLARGSGLSSLLGAYAVVGETGYDAGEVARFLLWHVAELDLYLCVFPLVAFVVLLARARSLDPPLQALLAAVSALSVWVLLVVSTFASHFASNRIQERNMFFLAPLFLIVLLAWVDRGAPRPRVVTTIAALVLGALAAVIPFDRFIETGATSDTLMLLPLWELQDRIGLDRVDEVVLVAGLIAAAAFLVVPRRFALALPLAVLVYFVLAFPTIQLGKPNGLDRASEGALYQGIRALRPRLDRQRRSGRGRGRARLDRETRPLHGQHERVLLPERRADLRDRPRRPRLAARDAGGARPANGPLPPAHPRSLRRRRRLDRAGRQGARAGRRVGPRGLGDGRRAHLDDLRHRSLPERHLVRAGGALAAASLSGRTAAHRPFERPDHLSRGSDRDRVREREACAQRALRPGGPGGHGCHARAQRRRL